MSEYRNPESTEEYTDAQYTEIRPAYQKKNSKKKEAGEPHCPPGCQHSHFTDMRTRRRMVCGNASRRSGYDRDISVGYGRHVPDDIHSHQHQ